MNNQDQNSSINGTTNVENDTNIHYVAVSFYQGPYNNRCLQVIGLTKPEEIKLLEFYGPSASNNPIKHVDIAGHTPLDITNYLAENFNYRIVSTTASQGEFVFVLERQKRL